jgi:ATP-dependent helicase HrpA
MPGRSAGLRAEQHAAALPDNPRLVSTPASPTQRPAPAPAAIPPISFPEALPVSARRDEIARAIAAHQVVIVCGETGSGKTTQLPKIALTLGRGLGAGGKGLIGHTQPRRIAASSVAKRIAEELATPLGEVVGFKVRFQDRLQGGASIKLMTDGILLAETQSDPLLRRYDTLIIDEAHERSLNIDFLLGYLARILPRRPDLKLIVTSATIDADRFARHFARADEPAPVIQVSGRVFPVEQRWRPFEESREYDLNNAIADAVDELWRDGAGDVLVFLPGEREIREAAEHLRGHHPPGVEVVPLFARLSQAEQDRVFEPHGSPRIVLATNVAETSLTVPGIRYVVDAGTARVKRYSYRNKVEQLLVEATSQAAANQRAGRCGRVSNGVCIRLYAEAEFAGRPRFTDPEIMRSSLAGVILRMKSLRLGDVEAFPFLEPPPRRAIADGYQLLAELGAVDDSNELTPIGWELTKLPLDPRVGRMILEARDRQALAEVLIVASAFTVQDVRDRPLEQQQAADNAHKKFDDERSEFLGDLKLWQWLEGSRGGPVRNEAAVGATPKLSSRKQEQLMREHFISPRRVREWRDLYSQLHTVVAEHGWRINQAPATYEQLHLSMLSGLLGNIGCKSDDDDWYLGARGIRFYRHPGANLSKKPGRWIVAAELIETTRLFGRGIAAIEPQWLPVIAAHVLKKQLLEPHWEKKAAEVIALERATLYGIVVYSNRRVNFGNVDPVAARELFIREALVAGEWDTRLAFIGANRKLIAQIQELEHKARRQDVLVDDELIHAFYDRHLPADVCSGATLERWYREESRANPNLLLLTRDELMRHEAASVTASAYPRTIRLGGVDCAATYLHDPGDAKDGLTVTVPIYTLNQVNEDRCEWLVPGMLPDKVLAMLKTLPQRPRSRLMPLAEFVANFAADAEFAQGGLLDALVKAVRDRTQLEVRRADFKIEQLSAHLLMNFRICDEHNRQLGTGRNLAALKAELGGQARSAFQALAVLKPPPVTCADSTPATAPSAIGPGSGKTATRLVSSDQESQPTDPHAAVVPAARYTDWTFDVLPELMEVRRGSQVLIGFPALIDKGAFVEIEVFDEPDVAQARHRAGLRRLFALQMSDALKYLEKNIPDLQRMAAAFIALGTSEELRTQIIEAAVDRAFLVEPLPTDRSAFLARLKEGRSRLNLIAGEVARACAVVLTEQAVATRKLRDARAPKAVTDDITAQLARLVTKRFVVQTPWVQLAHLPRYLKAVAMRLDKLRADPARDARLMADLQPLEQAFWRTLAQRKGQVDARLDDFRWQLEELRVGLFAQELRTAQPVSVKRLEKIWQQLTA